MLFNSYTFLWFLSLSLLIYWSANRCHLRWQNVLLLALSYVFYGWWDVRFLSLIVGVTAIGYLSALGMEVAGSHPKVRNAVGTLGIAASLGTLGAFKYYNFFVAELTTAFHLLGWNIHLPVWHVLLPVGISFFTFQTVSYIVDVRRGKLAACHDAVAYAAFISFFPQLVAGPIERATDLLPQMLRRRHLDYEDAVDGCRLILWGLFKKMVLADRCAPFVDMVYADPTASGADLWTATVLFAFQIYGDFSGYSDVAIGTARLFGIRLTRNFALPFFSRNVPELWRRWHISLMNWFKDYVYIPLGGSRHGRLMQLRNVCLVFLLSGLWHGANWTFIGWGLFQLIGFLPFILLSLGKRRRTPIVAEGRCLPSLRESAEMLTTFLFFCLGWVLFRSESIQTALSRMWTMCTENPLSHPFCGWSAFLPPLVVVCIEWAMRQQRHALDFPAGSLMGRHRALRWTAYYILILSILYFGGAQVQFIYFQF